MILLDKLHILLRSCYKGTEHAVYFPHGTISFKTRENVVRMSPGKAAMFSLCLYLAADGCFYARKHNSATNKFNYLILPFQDDCGKPATVVQQNIGGDEYLKNTTPSPYQSVSTPLYVFTHLVM